MEWALDLADYRRRVWALYAAARASEPPEPARWAAWRRGRDGLFRDHPQSPLDPARRRQFRGLSYFPYDPGWRVVAPLEPVPDASPRTVSLRDDGVVRLQPVGRVRFNLSGRPCALTVFWIATYGGGLFLPFRDTTNGRATYGGGRYLLDTIKGADLGAESGGLVLDFNYAYNPSCAYDDRWDCPLAPLENTLPVAVEAGERGGYG